MGVLFVLLTATVLGIVVCYAVGLGELGREWHVGIGLVGVSGGWALVAFFPIPYVIRVAVDGWPVYPVWAAAVALLGALLVGAFQPTRGA